MQFTPASCLAEICSGLGFVTGEEIFNPIPCGKYGLFVVLHLVLAVLDTFMILLKKSGVLCHGEENEMGR